MLDRFTELIQADLPQPASGRTLQRWRRLAMVAQEDLALTKLVESHFDATAILAELDATELVQPGQRWGVWAAEPPDARLSLGRTANGRKAWCSGAELVTHALVTGWDEADRPQLAAISLSDKGITLQGSAWQAVGMGRVPTPDLILTDVPFTPVGKPGQYVERPGFWQGGCGIAACWYGGTVGLADAVIEKAGRSQDPYLQAHLGRIDVALRSLRALLVEAASWIDQHPLDSAFETATRVRAAADLTAQLVLAEAARALGAGPLCRDAATAEHFADLPVFIRQTHAERDLAALAEQILAEGTTWSL